jgi:hypothetical protein
MKNVTAILLAMALLPSRSHAREFENSSDKNPPFSYYSTAQMQKLASAFVQTHGKTHPKPELLAKAAEFRGYLLAKAESWNKDWRGKCDGPAGRDLENPDDLVLQIAAIVAKVSATDISDFGESRPDSLLGFGVLGRCLLGREMK